MLLLMLGVASPLAAQGGKDDKADKDDESEGSDEAGEGEGEGDYEEPDAWERPPMDEEKPAPTEKGSAPAPTKKVGDGLPFMAGLVVGWGFKTDRATGQLGTDPYGLALGLMGGYTFDFQLYVGVRFTYFLGSTTSSEGGRGSPPSESTANYMHFLAEAGYDLWAADVIIRPGLLVGGAMAIRELTGVDDSETITVGDLMLGPGFTVAVPMDSFYIGGDLRGYLVTGDGVSGVGLNVVAGARFSE